MTDTKRPTITAARLAAFDILEKIERNQGNCDELLRGRAVDALPQLDRNLCTQLVMGTLRWQVSLDRDIELALTRPETKLSDEVRIALRLGVYQLVHLDRIPAHAAISESVELAKRGGNKYAAGMVNAVLRKLAASPFKSTHSLDSAKDVAEAYAHPLWLVERWAQRYSLATAVQICAFHQEQPPTHIRMSSEAEAAALASEGIELAPGEFLTHSRRVVRGNVTETVAYRRGLARIQDEGSQLVAELAGKGSKILDCCAAPGGKTAILAELNPEAEITACDVSMRRLEAMKSMLRNLPANTQIRFHAADAERLPFAAEFDLVLCDVPCSGTGTLARNPEIRHRLKPADLVRHHARQLAILLSAMKTVKPGGRLIYSTCSLESEENEDVVAAALEKDNEFRMQPLLSELDRMVLSGELTREGAALLTEAAFVGGCLRTLPGVQACDGFFAALLERAG